VLIEWYTTLLVNPLGPSSGSKSPYRGCRSEWSKLRVLVVGNGGREHAIAWKLSKSPRVRSVLCAPGNAGTGTLGVNLPVNGTDVGGILESVEKNAVDLVVVGPEGPLAAGLVDALADSGIKVFGPTKAAAEIESSKAFARSVMEAAGVKCANGMVLDSPVEAKKYLHTLSEPPVIKADGLAGGKGVTVSETFEQAEEAIDGCMGERLFGGAGDRIVIEERLPGLEASVFAFCDGEHVLTTVSACDYKRALDEDAGPNTGGMGSYSPPEFLSDVDVSEVGDTVIRPVVRELAKRGRPYVGVIYAGLMVHEGDVRVLEFNCRLGDPETQVVLPRLRTDLMDVIEATVENRLDGLKLEWDDRACVGIVMASGGYPGSYETGKRIYGLDEIDADANVFHAGTRVDGSAVVTDGGRVLSVVGLGEDLSGAQARAYANIERISFDGAHYRTDIAARPIGQALV